MAGKIRGVLIDHACRACDGQMMRHTESGPSGGGNPIYVCTKCDAGFSSLGPQDHCWCGLSDGNSFRCHKKSEPIPDGWQWKGGDGQIGVIFRKRAK